MSTRVRWGILGTGRICRKFAEALLALPEAELVAVGSRSEAAAGAFAAQFRIARAYGNYERLARDPDLEAIYIGTPHTFHCAHALLCLEARKAVLVEKPFSINEREARTMVDLARTRRVFLMEAMWTHFLPAVRRFVELARTGPLGDLRMFQADFGFNAPFDPTGRLFDPALGGGSLLDVGVYPVSLATRLFGEPVRIDSSAMLGRTGVDEQAAMILEYPAQRQAVLASSIRAETNHSATLFGSLGRLRLDPPFWRGQRIVLSAGGTDQAEDLPFEGNGFSHEALEVMRCLAGGLTESPAMTHDFSLGVMRTLDRIRAPWGLRYPGE